MARSESLLLLVRFVAICNFTTKAVLLDTAEIMERKDVGRIVYIAIHSVLQTKCLLTYASNDLKATARDRFQ
ncbi:unnamed protein product [Litomosoides sigmodontis]|uniref:Uncharacterized protein n=1 Tax=Litomosoides sigmodontis TaxID=42156 RepID=A0A3P6T4N9_LITSI|nr:unnamed protein product [Litomosoides sigmodontis]